MHNNHNNNNNCGSVLYMLVDVPEAVCLSLCLSVSTVHFAVREVDVLLAHAVLAGTDKSAAGICSSDTQCSGPSSLAPALGYRKEQRKCIRTLLP